MKLTALALTVAAAGAILAGAANARPVVTEAQVCTFNGVKEHCLATEDTDSFFVTWSDGTRVTYNKPASGAVTVQQGNNVYPARFTDLGNVVIFATQNGTTQITR